MKLTSCETFQSFFSNCFVIDGDIFVVVASKRQTTTPDSVIAFRFCCLVRKFHHGHCLSHNLPLPTALRRYCNLTNTTIIKIL